MSTENHIVIAGAGSIDRLMELHEQIEGTTEPQVVELGETTEIHLALLQVLLVAGRCRGLTVQGPVSESVRAELRRQGLERLWQNQFPDSL